MLRERLERHALAATQTYAIYEASGRYEMSADRPSLGDALDEFDARLDAPFATVGDVQDRELLELMGIA